MVAEMILCKDCVRGPEHERNCSAGLHNRDGAGCFSGWPADKPMRPQPTKCGDCKTFSFCSKFVGATDDMTECDWYPSRFVPTDTGMAEIKCDKSDDCNCCKCTLEWLRQDPEKDGAD